MWASLWLRCVGLVALRHVGSYFHDQGSNPRPLHWKADSQPLDCQGSPARWLLIPPPGYVLDHLIPVGKSMTFLNLKVPFGPAQVLGSPLHHYHS